VSGATFGERGLYKTRGEGIDFTARVTPNEGVALTRPSAPLLSVLTAEQTLTSTGGRVLLFFGGSLLLSAFPVGVAHPSRGYDDRLIAQVPKQERLCIEDSCMSSRRGRDNLASYIVRGLTYSRFSGSSSAKHTLNPVR